MKLLIVVPSFRLLGGISFHYLGLKKYWHSKVRYAVTGRRPHVHSSLTLLPDFIGYVVKLLTYRPDVVIVNPSFYPYPILRDAIHMLTARLMGCKVVAMFHGWNLSYSAKQEVKPGWTLRQFNKMALIYVLSSDYQSRLRKMGIHAPILLTTTEVDDALLQHFHIEQRQGRKIRNILFLARLDRAKGIFETIDAFALLHKVHPDTHLNIYGSSWNGALEAELEAYVATHHIDGITFHGRVMGNEKAQAFADNDIYILPSHFEGMPTSVLEAMAFGLPVVTRPVGGVPDFFEQGKMGYMVNSFSAADFAEKLALLINDEAATQRISLYNYTFARQHFLASTVAAKFEADIQKHIQ